MPFSMLQKLIITEIRGFRRERIKKIEKGETPLPLDNERKLAKIVLHLVPMKAFDPAMLLNLATLHKDLKTIKPIYTSVWNGQYNFDGLIVYGHSIMNKKDSIGSYVQIFRNGIIEAVDLRLLLEGYIRGHLFQEGLIEALPRFLLTQKEIGVEVPIFIMLSMLQVRGFYLHTDIRTSSPSAIDQDNLMIPEVEIDDWNSDTIQVLKPIFDIVWNTVGLPESISYDQIKK